MWYADARSLTAWQISKYNGNIMKCRPFTAFLCGLPISECYCSWLCKYLRPTSTNVNALSSFTQPRNKSRGSRYNVTTMWGS